MNSLEEIRTKPKSEWSLRSLQWVRDGLDQAWSQHSKTIHGYWGVTWDCDVCLLYRDKLHEIKEIIGDRK